MGPVDFQAPIRALLWTILVLAIVVFFLAAYILFKLNR